MTEVIETIHPRPYQSEALRHILTAYKKGVTRQLVSLPTGSGKTILFGLVARELKTKTLIVAHREELLYQTQNKLKLIYPNADMGFLQGQERGGLNAEICIASIQTATRHTEELSERGYNLLICDEAHHAVSDTYMRVFRDLGFLESNSEKLLIGVTATPYRGDGRALNDVFQEIVFERSIMTMMQAGVLCDIRGLRVFTGEDISTVHMQAGDFAVNELSAKVDTVERNALIADTYVKRGEGRHGVVFGVKVNHAMNLAKAFRERGVSCEAVYGDMPSDERHDILRRYANREIQILANVGVLTEGWDVPETDIIMMARPTKSRGLYVQCAGRGLRKAFGKTDCLLVDFVDIAQKHDLCGAGTLLGKSRLNYRDGESFLDVIERQEREQSEVTPGICQPPQYEEFDVFKRSTYSWQRIEANYKLSLLNDVSLWCVWQSNGYYPLVSSLTEGMRHLTDMPIPLNYAFGVCEDYVRGMGGAKYAMRNADWRNDPISEKQIAILQKNGMHYDANMTKGEASDLLAPIINQKPTEKQMYIIKKYKLHDYPELLSKKEAVSIIGNFNDRQ